MPECSVLRPRLADQRERSPGAREEGNVIGVADVTFFDPGLFCPGNVHEMFDLDKRRHSRTPHRDFTRKLETTNRVSLVRRDRRRFRAFPQASNRSGQRGSEIGHPEG